MKKIFSLFAAALVALSVTAAPARPPVEFDCTFTIDSLTHNSVYIAVTPADNSNTYFWDIFTEEEVNAAANGQLAQYGINSVEDLVMDYYNYYLQYGYDLSVQGSDERTYTGLTPSTAYLVLALQIDVTTGKAVNEVNGDTFDTKKAPADSINNVISKINVVKKVIMNDKVIIICGECTFNANGARLK